MKKTWFVIDETLDTIWSDNLDTTSVEKAITEAIREWKTLTAYDRKRRNAFYIILAEEDEDGEVNWETVDKKIDIAELDEEVIEAAQMIADAGYDQIVMGMDDEIRESINYNMVGDMTNLEFLVEYRKQHEAKFGEEFTI